MKLGNHLITIITHVFTCVEFFAREQAQTCAGYHGLSHLDFEFESTTVRTIRKDHSGIETSGRSTDTRLYLWSLKYPPCQDVPSLIFMVENDAIDDADDSAWSDHF